MSAWPTTLPTTPLISGFNRTYMEHKDTFKPTGGKSTDVLYFTAVPEIFTVSFLVNKSQRAILHNFYKVTTLFGTQYFTFTDPETFDTIQVRFVGTPPAYVAESDNWFKASFQLETLP